MNIRMLSSNAEQAMREIEQCVALQKAVGWEGEVVPPHVFRADALSRIDSDIDLGYLIIAVEDDGVAMSGSTSDALFEIFTRTKTSNGIEGTGLGLAIIKELAEKHGGTAWMEVNAKGGVTVSVSISKHLA